MVKNPSLTRTHTYTTTNNNNNKQHSVDPETMRNTYAFRWRTIKPLLSGVGGIPRGWVTWKVRRASLRTTVPAAIVPSVQTNSQDNAHVVPLASLNKERTVALFLNGCPIEHRDGAEHSMADPSCHLPDGGITFAGGVVFFTRLHSSPILSLTQKCL